MTRLARHVQGEELPFYFENWDCWCISYTSGELWSSQLETGISYNRGYRLETVTFVRNVDALHKIKCSTFSSHFAYLLKEEAYCWILQHFQLILPTYLKKKHIVKYMQIMRMYVLLNRWATRNMWSTQAWSSTIGKWCFRHQENPTESAAHLILEPVHQKVHTIHTKSGVEY